MNVLSRRPKQLNRRFNPDRARRRYKRRRHRRLSTATWRNERIRHIPDWLHGATAAVVKFGQIVGSARRLQFAVADGGSRASFEFLQKVDPNGLGRARNIQVVENARKKVITIPSVTYQH